MAPRNIWDDWLQGGRPPTSQVAIQPLKGYSALTGDQGPRDPMVYRPDVIQNGGRDDAANGSPLGRIGSRVPGAWYSDIPQTSFNEFISEENADWFRREWAKTHNMGQRTEEALARFSPLPQYWLHALGQGDKFNLTQENAPQKQADLMGKLYGRLLGPDQGYIDPKGIMQNIVGATWDGKNLAKNDYIASMMADPKLSADAQVSNFWNFVNGTVGRLMPKGTMQAYQSIIERESDLYRDFMAKNPSVSLTFNRWIGQRLGPTGGL